MSEWKDEDIRYLLRIISLEQRTEVCLILIKDFLEKFATADTKRLDWLGDVSNTIGNITLPMECVQRNLSSLRDAIDDAMEVDKILGITEKEIRNI